MSEKSVAAQPAMARKNDADDPSIHAEQIGVTVNNGVVTLDGRVDSLWDKHAAERAPSYPGKLLGPRICNQNGSDSF